MVEQCPFKAWVAGSSPAALTIAPHQMTVVKVPSYAMARSIYIAGSQQKSPYLIHEIYFAIRVAAAKWVKLPPCPRTVILKVPVGVEVVVVTFSVEVVVAGLGVNKTVTLEG